MTDSTARAGALLICAGLIVVPLVMAPDLFRFAALPKLYAVHVLAVSLSVCAAVAALRGRHGPVSAAMLLFFLIHVPQALRSLNASEGFFVLAAQLSLGTIAFAVATLLTRETREVVVMSAVGAGFAVTTLGLLEFAGVSAATFPSAGRPSATLGFRNAAATWTAMTLPLAAWLAVSDRSARTWLGVAATATCAAFLLVTRSRGAWLGGLAGSGVAVILLLRVYGRGAIRRRALVVTGALAIGVLLSAIPQGFEDRSDSRLDEKKATLTRTVRSISEAGGDRGRLAIWRHTLEMIAAHPVTGVGLANWSPFYPAYDRGEIVNSGTAPLRPHNDALWIWSELGIVGFGLFLLTLGILGRHVVRWAGSDGSGLAVAVAAAMTAWVVHGLFSFPREEAAPSLLFWVLAGLTLAEGGTRAGNAARWRAGVWACGAAIGIAGAWVTGKAIAFDSEFAAAVRAQAAGQPARQLERAEAALRHGVFDHRAYLMAGDALTQMGKGKEAAEVYAAYRAVQPHLPAVLNNQSRALSLSGNFAQAEEAARAGLAVLEGDRQLMNSLAEALRGQGRYEEGALALEGMATLTADEYHNLGVLQAQQGNLDRAVALYDSALARDPAMHVAHYSKAGLLLLMKRNAEAIETYETYLASASENATLIRRAEERLGQLYGVAAVEAMEAGDYGRAGELYERIAGLGEMTAAGYHNVALIRGRSGDVRGAVAACRAAIVADNRFAPPYLTLAQVYDRMGESENAAANYRAFVERADAADPRREMASARLGALTAP